MIMPLGFDFLHDVLGKILHTFQATSRGYIRKNPNSDFCNIPVNHVRIFTE